MDVDTSSIEMRNVENDKLDVSPTDFIQTELLAHDSSENKTLSFSNNIVVETETVAQNKAATESNEKAPQSKKENCLSANQETSSLFTHNPKQIDDESELCSNMTDRQIETVCKTVRRIGRPKKEVYIKCL